MSYSLRGVVGFRKFAHTCSLLHKSSSVDAHFSKNQVTSYYIALFYSQYLKSANRLTVLKTSLNQLSSHHNKSRLRIHTRVATIPQEAGKRTEAPLPKMLLRLQSPDLSKADERESELEGLQQQDLLPSNPAMRVFPCPGPVERYVNGEGKVALMYSPGFGAGWSSREWCDSKNPKEQEIRAFDKDIVEAILQEDYKLAASLVNLRASGVDREDNSALEETASEVCVAWLGSTPARRSRSSSTTAAIASYPSKVVDGCALDLRVVHIPYTCPVRSLLKLPLLKLESSSPDSTC
ncbi:MAG: hypothetical protein Q9184_006780 [Pyrenodesmia sp. 2 TL-2023]